MYLDREWRIPQSSDSPVVWPGDAAWMAVYSPYCCGWHVTGVGACYTDPMGLLITYGNDWQPRPNFEIARDTAEMQTEGNLLAIGVATLLNLIHL